MLQDGAFNPFHVGHDLPRWQHTFLHFDPTSVLKRLRIPHSVVGPDIQASGPQMQIDVDNQRVREHGLSREERVQSLTIFAVCPKGLANDQVN